MPFSNRPYRSRKSPAAPLRVTVVGGGLAGLASACLLAAKGHQVDLFEQNDTPGGKMQEHREGGFRFDTGPSLFTMPFLLERIFEACGRNVSDYLEWVSPDPLCRYQFSDGVVFTNYQDADKNRNELLRVVPEDADNWDRFLDYSASLYRRTADTFLFNPLKDLTDLEMNRLPDMLRIDAFSTVSRRVDAFFNSDRMRQLFKRFTTYNGSSPFLAPATLNVIPYVELRLGGFYVRGGMYRLTESLVRLATDLGVRLHTGTQVDLIVPDPARKRSVSGVMIHGYLHEADVVVANSDATETYLKLLPEKVLSGLRKRRIRQIEPSCSGFVVLLGIRQVYDHLQHHNIFFSEDYEDEFRAIFERHELPVEPTIYVTNTSLSDPEDAPPGCSNLFILANAPYVGKDQPWHEWMETYTDHLILTLEARGLSSLRDSIVVRRTIMPPDFKRLYGSNRGSIYGTSSNSRNAAFIRPRNQSPWFRNLYLCGGSTHPGGGIPLVLQSAMNVAALLERQTGD